MLRKMHRLAPFTTLLYSSGVKLLQMSKADTSRRDTLDDCFALVTSAGGCRFNVCMVSSVATFHSDACLCMPEHGFDHHSTLPDYNNPT